MIRYYAGSDVDRPEPVECGPTLDAKGRLQSDDHVDTEAAAWERLVLTAESTVLNEGRMVNIRRRLLQEAETRAAEAAARFARIRENRYGDERA